MLLGGIYIAISAALSNEGIALANDVLFDLSKNPTFGPEEANIFRLIADAATLKDEPETARHGFQVIDGGRSRSSNVGWATSEFGGHAA